MGRHLAKIGWNHAKDRCVPCHVDSVERHLAAEVRSLCDIDVYRQRDMRSGGLAVRGMRVGNGARYFWTDGAWIAV